MALKATIHRATVEVSDVDRGVYESLRLTLARHPSESAERLVVRLLAFALRLQDGLEFGRGVSTVDEPDLWSRSGDGRILEWIEVGQPDADRLVKASRRAERVCVFACGGGLERWWERQVERLSGIQNLSVWRIDDATVAALVEDLDRSIEWTVTVCDGSVMISLAAGEEIVEMTPAPLLSASSSG